jgi:hypothetical protein
MNPGINDVHVSQPLTNIAINYRPQQYVQDKLAPYVKTSNRTGIVYGIPRTRMSGYAGSATPTGRGMLRSPTGVTNSRGGWVPTQQTFAVEEFGENDMVHPDIVAEADSALQVRKNTVEAISEDLIREREFRVRTLVQTVANYHTDCQGTTPSTKWTNIAADILAPIQLAKTTIRKYTLGREGFKILINHATWLAVQKNTDLKDRIKYVMAITVDQINPALLARYWDVDEVIIAGCYFNSAAELATEVIAEIWDDDVVIFHPETPSLQFLGFCQTYSHKAGGFETRTWRDSARKNAEVIEVNNYADEVMVNNFAGYILPDVLA